MLDPSQVTVVIPAFNEAEALGDVLAELRTAIPDIRILVVDDGSSDGTEGVARSAGVKVLRHNRNRGYGAALKTGFRAAATPYVAMYDADGQHRPDDLLQLMQHGGQHDMVVGARGNDSDRAWSRRPGKWVLARIANHLTGTRIPDLNSGLRVIRRNVMLRYIHLLPDGFSASTTSTICLVQRGYDVAFPPIRTRQRKGKSTVRQVRDGMNTIALIVNLIILFSPGRFFVPPAVLLIAAGLVYGVARALVSGLGIPTLALLLVMTGLITGLFGLLAKQIATLRIELFERDDALQDMTTPDNER